MFFMGAIKLPNKRKGSDMNEAENTTYCKVKKLDEGYGQKGFDLLVWSSLGKKWEWSERFDLKRDAVDWAKYLGYKRTTKDPVYKRKG